jgi:hypothetical protein
MGVVRTGLCRWRAEDGDARHPFRNARECVSPLLLSPPSAPLITSYVLTYHNMHPYYNLSYFKVAANLQSSISSYFTTWLSCFGRMGNATGCALCVISKLPRMFARMVSVRRGCAVQVVEGTYASFLERERQCALAVIIHRRA